MATKTSPRWMSQVLKIAALYNIGFGLLTLVSPNWLFDVLGAERPNYPELWQCIGMIVGVYGFGYWIAAFDPMKHWPIVLVGLIGKILGPIGFVKAVWVGTFPLSFGVVILFNDLIWWAPFGLIVSRALSLLTKPELKVPTDSDVQTFNRFQELSFEKPTLAVFMRHAGCTFCREGLADLAFHQDKINATGARVFLVHMGEPGDSEFANKAKEAGIPESWTLISDPGRALYQLAGITRGQLRQVFSLKTFVRGFVAGVLGKHGVGPVEGDGFMMPGAFVWSEGQLVCQWRPASPSERLPLEQILSLYLSKAS